MLTIEDLYKRYPVKSGSGDVLAEPALLTALARIHLDRGAPADAAEETLQELAEVLEAM